MHNQGVKVFDEACNSEAVTNDKRQASFLDTSPDKFWEQLNSSKTVKRYAYSPSFMLSLKSSKEGIYSPNLYKIFMLE